MENRIVKGVTVKGMLMILVMRIRFISVVMFVFVINGTVACYWYNYVFGMMVMGNQVVSQKDGETQGKNQRYVGSGFQDCL